MNQIRLIFTDKLGYEMLEMLTFCYKDGTVIALIANGSSCYEYVTDIADHVIANSKFKSNIVYLNE